MKNALLMNGYPKSFIDAQWQRAVTNRDRSEDDERRKVTLRMQFRGDSAAELFFRKIERSVKLNCLNIYLIPVFTSRPMLSTQTKDRLSKLATPNVVYRYECDICHLQYIGLTERRLEERVKEHAPRWAMLGLHGMSQSSVTDHIVGEGHPCNRQEASEIIYRSTQ